MSAAKVRQIKAAKACQSTLFGRLEEIRANVKRVRADVMRLRASIRGPASVGGERTSAEDLRIQLRQALEKFDDLLPELTPIADLHSDQPIRATSETAHG
jgi:hypothetical protein